MFGISNPSEEDRACYFQGVNMRQVSKELKSGLHWEKLLNKYDQVNLSKLKSLFYG